MVHEMRLMPLYFSCWALSIDVSTGKKQEGNYIQQESRNCLLRRSFLARAVLNLTVQVVPHTLGAMVFISDLN